MGTAWYGLWTTLVGLGLAVACSGGNNGNSILPTGSGGASNGVGAGPGSSGSISVGVGGGILVDGGGDSAPHPCQGLECRQTTCQLGDCVETACAGGGHTTLSGTVYDPAGKVPLYNVVVYVPNGEVPPLSVGASCDRCGASITNPVASALTDTFGKFTLDDVPVGQDVPLVIQVGKWRRQITVPNVPRCVNTELTDPNLTRLPRNQSEGDIPLIALATGGADSMECLPRRMGVDDSEFTTDSGNGRIHLYAGQDNNRSIAPKAFAATLNGGAAFTPATTLWSDTAHLSRYDIVILSCEGNEIPAEKPVASRQALYDYEGIGGRVFASHFHHYWFSAGPTPVPTVGTWSTLPDPQSPAIGVINTTFPKGAALSDWLVNVGASTTPGQMDIIAARDNLQAVNTMANWGTEWITTQNQRARNGADPNAVQYMSYNAPLGVDPSMQCGRAVFTDLHVSATGDDMVGSPFPSGCAERDLSPQEKAVEFMLFDLSACLQSDSTPPEPPPVPK